MAELDIMYHVLNVSYVAVWEKPLDDLPILDPDFCKNVFGYPEGTVVKVVKAGIEITLNRGYIQVDENKFVPKVIPQIVIGHEKFIYIHDDIDQLDAVYSKLLNELKEKHSTFYEKLSVGQIGINSNYNANIPDSSNEYLKSKFSLSTNGTSFKDVFVQELRFALLEEIQGRFVNVTIQQRTSGKDIIISVNAHESEPTEKKLLEPVELLKRVKVSIGRFDKEIKTLI